MPPTPPSTPTPPHPPPLPPAIPALCIDTCTHASDGDCDDGGAGSEFGMCTFGSDCTDCGERHSQETPPRAPSVPPPSVPPPPSSPSPPGPPPLPPWLPASCSNDCTHASDGDCDDGGAGSEYAACLSGSDCADCGARHQ
eukprot:6352771-Prymnesium_polylepis.1